MAFYRHLRITESGRIANKILEQKERITKVERSKSESIKIWHQRKRCRKIKRGFREKIHKV